MKEYIDSILEELNLKINDTILCSYYGHDCGGDGQDFYTNSLFKIINTKHTYKAMVPINHISEKHPNGKEDICYRSAAALYLMKKWKIPFNKI